MTYWFLRMKEGKDGEDFTGRMWQQNLIGILWGTWELKHILSNGEIDETKLSVEEIERQRPQPKELEFDERWLQAPRTFLLKMKPGDRVVVHFDNSLHIGAVGEIYEPGTDLEGSKFGERFKCRSVYLKKSFALSELPSIYRLVSGTGQGTIQRINAYERQVGLLDRYENPKEVREALLGMPLEEFLQMLSDKQWEVLCAEYLRKYEDFRPLLLSIGGSLKDIDIYGVGNNNKRILAQCKNTSKPWKAKDVAKWANAIGSEPGDVLFFFCRGGFKGEPKDSRCQMRSGEDILEWLNQDTDYQQHLRTY